MRTIEFLPADVQTDDKGRMFVECACGLPSYLGVWGAAHIGAYDLTAQCERCGDSIVITRGVVPAPRTPGR